MNEETYGALKRIIEEVKEKRRAECLNKYCVVNQIIGGNDIDLVESWILVYALGRKELVKDAKSWIEDFKKTQPANLMIDYDTFEGSAFMLLNRLINLSIEKVEKNNK